MATHCTVMDGTKGVDTSESDSLQTWGQNTLICWLIAFEWMSYVIYNIYFVRKVHYVIYLNVLG